jgi:hypothetical protein
VITALAGVGIIVLSALYVIVDQIFRRGIIYITYFLGDLVSRTTMRVGEGYGYGLYSWLMLKSSNLDTEDILWKTPCKEHPEIEQACCHQRKKHKK